MGERIKLIGTGQLDDPFTIREQSGEIDSFNFVWEIFDALKSGRDQCYFVFAGQLYFLDLLAENETNVLFKVDQEIEGVIEPVDNNDDLKTQIIKWINFLLK